MPNTTQITWTREAAGNYTHAGTDFRIKQGESGNWLVYGSWKGKTGLVATAPTLSRAKLVAKPFVLAALELAEAVADAHAEAIEMEAARIVEQDGADALIHFYDVNMQTPDGVDLMSTPYTYGSPELHEVTCPVCLSIINAKVGV